MKVLSLLSLGCACALPLPSMAVEIFSETFDYSGWSEGETPMNAVWTGVGAGARTIVAGVPDTPFPTSYLALGNSAVTTGLGQTITGDFSLSISILHSTTQRFQWVSITSDTGEGYGFGWSSDNSPTGSGSVKLRRYDVLPTAYNSNGTAITANASSGHAGVTLADSTTPATFTLSWASATNTLTLEQEGSIVSTLSDPALTYNTFSRVTLSGNTSGYFDDLSVSAAIPEPSTYGAVLGSLALTAAVFTSRRRR